MFKTMSRLSLPALTGMLLLSACSSFKSNGDGKIDYQSLGESSSSKTKLEVPPDLTQLSRDSRYIIPGSAVSANQLQANQAKNAVQTNAVAAANTTGGIEVGRQGEIRWLTIRRPFEAVWPQVRDFWLQAGFTFTREEKDIGLLETEWAENRAKLPQNFITSTLSKVLQSLQSTGERDKFRIRIEQIDSQTTEIYVTHRGLVEVYTDANRSSTTWQPRPADLSLENEFLKRIMLAMGSTPAQAEQAVAAKEERPSNTKLADNKTSFEYALGFDVAWRRVGVSLDRSGFTVEDRDRRQGVYYVRYLEPTKAEPGFFSKLFSSSSTENATQRFRIQLEPQDSKTRISVLNNSGVSDSNNNVAQKIAQILVEDLR